MSHPGLTQVSTAQQNSSPRDTHARWSHRGQPRPGLQSCRRVRIPDICRQLIAAGIHLVLEQPVRKQFPILRPSGTGPSPPRAPRAVVTDGRCVAGLGEAIQIRERANIDHVRTTLAWTGTTTSCRLPRATVTVPIRKRRLRRPRMARSVAFSTRTGPVTDAHDKPEPAGIDDQRPGGSGDLAPPTVPAGRRRGERPWPMAAAVVSVGLLQGLVPADFLTFTLPTATTTQKDQTAPTPPTSGSPRVPSE